MPDELKQLIADLPDWPSDLQQKVISAILAIRAEYIDGDVDDDLSS